MFPYYPFNDCPISSDISYIIPDNGHLRLLPRFFFFHPSTWFISFVDLFKEPALNFVDLYFFFYFCSYLCEFACFNFLFVLFLASYNGSLDH